jgi:hypothetical protein
MLVLKLTLVAFVVLAASLISKRFGHGVAGTLSGMPMIAGPIMGFVLMQSSAEHGRDIALATLVAFPAMVMHMVVFARASRRIGWLGSLIAANLAFLKLGVVLIWLHWPAWAACGLAAVSPLVGMRLMPAHRHERTTLTIPRVELALRVAAAMALAAALIFSASAFPAAVSGLLLALPITGNVLPCFTLSRHGPDATIELLRGFVQGMFGFVTFFVVLYAMLPVLGPLQAYVLAWLAALLLAQVAYAIHARPAQAVAS